MEEIWVGAQPHCPNDDVVMSAVSGGWLCPECGHVQQVQDVEIPVDLDGADIEDR